MLFIGWVDCLDPTQITLEISTDIPCSELHETSISSGTLAQLESRPAVATTAHCEPATGRVGSIVLVPGQSGDAATRVVAAFGARKTADECVAAGFKGGCIVARRSVRYVSHTRLRLPVRLEGVCADMPCKADETCVNGQCVPAMVDCDPIVGCVPSTDGGAVATIARSFGGAGDDWVSALARDADGNVYVGGMISGQVDFGRGAVTAFAMGSPFATSFDAMLAPRWTYVQAAKSSSAAYGIAVTAANAYLAGAADGIDNGAGTVVSNAAFYEDLKSQDGAPVNGQAFVNTRGYAVAADDQGNVWLGGLCFFGMGNILGATCPPGAFLLAAFDANKKVRWMKALAANTAGGTVTSLALRGNHLIAGGVITAPLDIGGGPLPYAGMSDAFVASFRADDGSHEWSRSFGDAGLQVVHGVASDASSVWAVGDMGGSLVAGGMTLTSAGYDDVFVLRLDPASGAPIFARRFGGPNEENGRAIAVDPKGNAWMCGWFQTSGDFGGGNVSSKGTQDVFVTSLGTDGMVRAARAYGGTGSSQCYAIAADARAIYLGGQLSGTLDFGGGSTPLKSAGVLDGFVVKMAE